MNLNYLKTFLQICSDKSIRKAAISLFMTPQALSKQITKLESFLGVPLFYRSKSGIQLTEYGELLHDYAEKVIDMTGKLEKNIELKKESRKNSLTIACSYGILVSPLGECIEKYKSINPDLNFCVVEDTDKKIHEAILNRQASIAVTLSPKEKDMYEIVPLKCFQLRLLMGCNNILSQKNKIDVKDLRNQRIILNNEYRTFDIIFTECKKHHFIPEVVDNIIDPFAAQRYCLRNEAVFLTTDFLDEMANLNGLKSIPFIDNFPKWETVIMYHKNKDLTEKEMDFVRFLTENV